MNLFPLHASRITPHATRPRRRQSGSAVIVVMALLAIMLIYVGGNLRTLANLGRELRALEHQQTRRLQKAAAPTNAPPAITVSTNSMPTPLAR